MDGIKKRLLILAALLAVFGIYYYVIPTDKGIQIWRDSASFPWAIGDWNGADVNLDNMAVTDDIDWWLFRKYTSVSQDPVYLYIGYRKSFREGKSLFAGKNISPGYGWRLVEEEELLKDVEGKEARIRKAVFHNAQRCRIVYYWYYTDDGVVSDRDKGRFSYALDAMLNKRTHVSLVKISTPTTSSASCPDGTDVDDFIDNALPVITEYLPFAL